MQVKEVSIGLGRTINLGNYQSRKVDAGMVAVLEPGEDAMAACEDLGDMVRQALREQIKIASDEKV